MLVMAIRQFSPLTALGTGKSFIGALIAKAIFLHSAEKILVVCYTHHALDQFLEDLMDQGIHGSEIIRIGNAVKATARTKPLSLFENRGHVKPSNDQWRMLATQKLHLMTACQNLESAYKHFQGANASKAELFEHLEFRTEGLPFFDAFQMPEEDHNVVRVGKRGKAVDEFYLLDRWWRGKDAGSYRRKEVEFPEIWKMKATDRIATLNSWKAEILEESVARVHEAGTVYNRLLEQVHMINIERDLKIIRRKRIIGCTTTAAAKNVQALQAVAPGVLLVEEAGEILESHVLTALGPDTKQLIMIGDHQQLRPKVHYDLSVEKGDGYDLNRSLFERLVLSDYPHQVLFQQHRMRPEISSLVRHLTYPDLVDAPSTSGRPDLRGCRDNLIFINHNKPEVDLHEAQDLRDTMATSSKKNPFEAEMTLKCVRYLGQQGYQTSDVVVLTPYLGQLRVLVDELRKENDPVLADLDSYDLVRAGLMPETSSSMEKPQIRISTIGKLHLRCPRASHVVFCIP